MGSVTQLLADPNTVAALAVAAVILYLAVAGLAIRAGVIRGVPMWAWALFGIFAAPVAVVVFGFWPWLRRGSKRKSGASSAATVPSAQAARAARGAGFFSRGPDGAFSLGGFAGGFVLAFGSIAGAYATWRYAFDVEGEQLQWPVVRAFMLGGFIGGAFIAYRARRVGFIESLFVTGVCALIPVVFQGYTQDLFTYGTAAAYYGVVLVAGGLLLLLALTLGGSFGYMFTGDGGIGLSWSYENWIGRRFLMGKRSNNVVGIITIISVLAVAVGTCAMIVVMSVMNGFSTDLRSKIFGANAHLIVLKYGNDFTDYQDVRDTSRRVAGVSGASPFVLNEVMVSSDANLTGALLKGFDEPTIDQVSILRQNVVEGDLSHVAQPSKIPVAKVGLNAGRTKSTKPKTALSGKAGAKPARIGDKIGAGGSNPDAAKGVSGADTAPDLIPFDPLLDDAPGAPPMDADRAMEPVETKGEDAKSELSALEAALAAATEGTPAGDKVAAAKGEGNLLPGIAIGKEMSRNLKVYVGDVINVVSPVGELGPTGPVPKARAFRVAAIFFSGMYEYDSKFIYIDVNEAMDFFSLDGSVTGIEYKVDDIEQTQAIARKILKRIGGYPYRTKDWMEMNKNLFSALKLEKIAMFIILTFIILVASFLIAATLIVFVIEKSKEIAILKSMGATDTSVMKVFVTYGVIVGTVGALSGLGVGLLLCYGIKTFGIGLDPDVYYITNLPVHVDSTEAVVVALAAIILSYLATIYPSLLAARLRPVEGLRLE